MATGCKEIHDICPNCAGAHSGKECDKPLCEYKCINCLKAKLRANHAVWDKDCPSMLAEKKKKAERSPDSSYKFYLMKEEWTWERRDGVSDNGGTVLTAGPSKEVERNGVAEQGRRGVGVPDGGWEGIRAKRVLEEVSRQAGTIRPPASQLNHKGKDKETEAARPAMQTSSSSSRSRSGTTSGRQSVLGEYWRAEVPGSVWLAASEISDPQG